MIEYTTVCGVDAKHLKQLAMVWPTWKRHKPSLLDHPMLIFFDWRQVDITEINSVCGDHPNLLLRPWPPDGVEYSGTGTHKWNDPPAQRWKMLSGFVHVPSSVIYTKYWLKLDTDTIATGCDDWIDENWFDGDPAIVAQKWGFTKPANQMMLLDGWADDPSIWPVTGATRPLDLKPKSDAGRLSHKRIISWCGFFRTDFSRFCSDAASRTCGVGQIPVPSQDGFMWYCVKRLGEGIVRINVKPRGWLHRSSMRSVESESVKAMQNVSASSDTV